MESAHPGTEPWEQSWLEVMPANVSVLAIKQAESTKESTIIRLQERSGSASKATLKSAALGLDHSIALAPWEIKTLLIKRVAGSRAEVKEVSLLETA
jgi:alpha-mannosidase